MSPETYVRDIGVKTTDFIKFNPKVGTDYGTVTGLPGWGKTHLTHMLTLDAIRNGAVCLFPGDKFCEWRHFFRYPKSIKKITLIIPKGQEIKYFNMPNDLEKKYGITFEKIELNYWDLEVEELIPEGTSSEIFVIYDAHYRYDPKTKTKNLWRKADLWVTITSQLNDRITNLDKAFVTPYHEAGILFKQKASDKHWHSIEAFCEALVDCRKGYVQPIFVAQRPTEIEINVRDKCLWHFYRKGKADKFAPDLIKKITPFASRSEYQVTYGGLYIAYNQIEKFDEVPEIWKMVPRGTIPDLEHEMELQQTQVETEFVETDVSKVVPIKYLREVMGELAYHLEQKNGANGNQRIIENVMNMYDIPISDSTISKHKKKIEQKMLKIGRQEQNFPTLS